MNRRTVLKGGLVLSLASHSAVASGDVATLNALIAEHTRALDDDSAAWNEYSDIEEVLEANGHGLPKVVVSQFQRPDGQLEPVYAYSEVEISAAKARHLNFPFHVSLKNRQKIAESYDVVLEDFQQQQAQFDLREIQSGLTAVRTKARAASDRVRKIEAAIVAFVPTSLSEAARKAAWCAWAYRNERCYLKDEGAEAESLIAALQAIANAN